MSKSPQRLQKILAAAGYGSRRQCEEFINKGRVEVNGTRARLGQKADPSLDSIFIDGEPIVEGEQLAYFMLNKPTGVLSSLKTQGGHPTVSDLVPVAQRVYPVGRLDLESEGLILMTNDGDLTHRLTHPSYEHEKEYLVWLDKLPDTETLKAWRAGLHLPGLGRSAPARVEVNNAKDIQLRVIMHEGMNRQIRLTARTLGLQVLRLQRIRICTLMLGELKTGQWRTLIQSEITDLRREVNLLVSQEVDG